MEKSSATTTTQVANLTTWSATKKDITTTTSNSSATTNLNSEYSSGTVTTPPATMTTNILAIQNQAPLPTRLNQLGGRVSQTFDYDEIYQLIGASGDYEAKNRKDRYMVNMQYDDIHNMSEDKRVCGAHSPEAQDGKLCLSKAKSKATKLLEKSSIIGAM
ncbi:hypothetical protein [Psychrobacter sp. I-STPA6b]|uniref:hypothetical protein n=1 Tax=Psychrobacter sp. I-STPA6b TaxID=2585718 RepID=UPI001D0C7E3E|nr:hypothetical protein [Psychrobacter sp. I-STPA6b]